MVLSIKITRGMFLGPFLAIALPVVTLAGSLGHLEVKKDGTRWSYTAANDNLKGDAGYVTAINLQVNAPLQSVEAPKGWKFTTDNKTFIQWYASDAANGTDATVLSPGDIAPGEKLSGFNLEAKDAHSAPQPSNLVFYDHARKEPGIGSGIVQIESPSNQF